MVTSRTASSSWLAARIAIREELWLSAEYAAIRKESSKTGSIFLVRFFLGFYPSEVSLLAQSLAQLEDRRAARMHGALRNSAKRVLHVLVTRYAIDLEDHP